MPRSGVKMQDLNWNDLRYVLAVARALAPASRWLGVDETTVARRLSRVETSLGSKLFDRLDGVMQPTEAGQFVVHHAERMEIEIDLLKASASGTDAVASGTVRVTSIPMIVNRLLIPALPGLYMAYPRLRLEAIAEPRNLSLTRREADIALRLARPDREQNVIARRIGELTYSVYGPRNENPRDLPWITYEDGMESLPHVVWIDNAIKQDKAGLASLKVNDSEVVLHAIRAGLGKSLLPCVIGDAEPGLIRMDHAKSVLSREVWLLVHPEIRKISRISIVIDWLGSTISQATKSKV
jgi:DNA-binding transcriptional LysR family regulator